MKESGGLARPWYRSPVTGKGGKGKKIKKAHRLHRLHSSSKKVSTRWTGSPWVKITYLKTLVSSRNRPASVSLLYSLTGRCSMKSKPRTEVVMGFRAQQLGPSVSHCPPQGGDLRGPLSCQPQGPRISAKSLLSSFSRLYIAIICIRLVSVDFYIFGTHLGFSNSTNIYWAFTKCQVVCYALKVRKKS